MSGTQVTQVRSAVVINAVNTYQVIATCILPGTLPDTGIFVLNITQQQDPKNDLFVRIASTLDFSNLKNDRNAAIAAGDGAWRATTNTFKYTSIEVADAAWRELESRISALVTSFDNFINAFQTPPAGVTTIFPVPDPSTLNALITAYNGYTTSIDSAETARTEEVNDCNVKKERLDQLNLRLRDAQSDLSTARSIQTGLTTSLAALTAIQASIQTTNNNSSSLISASSAASSEKAQLQSNVTLIANQLFAMNVQLADLTARVTIINGFVADLTNRVATLTSQVNALTSEITACDLEAARLQANVDALRTSQTNTLADIRAICPDFDPANQ